MGLLKSGVKYGAIFMVAREGVKAWENRKGDKYSHQQQQHQQQPLLQEQSRSTEQLPYSQQSPQQQPQPQLLVPRDLQGAFHQHWCNGQCGNTCVTAETLRSIGVDVKPTGGAPGHDVKQPVY